MQILTVNAGSSSLKLRLLQDEELIASADPAAGADDLDAAGLEAEIGDWPRPDAIGHRIVHGGTFYASAVRIDGEVENRLRELTELAPLHQPKSLAGLAAVSELYANVPAFACFDTAFHRSIGDAAALYAIPPEWTERGVRRYGFHGLSHAYVGRRACELTGRPVDGTRVISCHLGAGASLCAIRNGRSVDTTMGFTPLEGLVMATRSGTVDPGLVLWLEQNAGLTADEVTTVLETRSGLYGLAGTPDLQEVQQAADDGDARARTALAVYVHRLVAGIGAMAAALGGVDLLVFTGGVGENSASIRQLAADRLGWMGVSVGTDRNAEAAPDTEVSAPAATVRTVLVAAREDLQMAREIRDRWAG